MDGFSKYHFKFLGENEEIVAVLHRNWFYLLSQFFFVFFISGLFAASVLALPKLFPDFVGPYQQVVYFMQNSFLLAIWIYCFLIWIDYYFDIWIITTQRIVNIEQKGMFTRKVSETSYDKIQDITTEVVGFIPTVLNFGDLRVQTAGEKEEFIFRTISDPYHIKNIIVQLQKQRSMQTTEYLGQMIKEKIGA